MSQGTLVTVPHFDLTTRDAAKITDPTTRGAVLDLIRSLDVWAQKVRQWTSQVGPPNFILVPSLAADPTSPVNGMMWYNSTSKTFKGYVNGAIKTFTLS